MKLRIVATAAFASLLFVSAASASSVALDFQDFHDPFAGGSKSVTLRSFDGMRFANGHTSINVAAGGIALTDGVNNFVAWCLDVAHWFQPGSQYNTTTTPFSSTTGTLSTAKLNDIKALFGVNYSGLNLASNTQSAGFQLALWEIVNEHWGAYDVTKGSFRVSNVSSQTLAFANSLLGALSDSIQQAFDFTFYESVANRCFQSQNLVSVTPVPIPAAGLLLGAGLFGLVGVGRRRKTKTATA